MKLSTERAQEIAEKYADMIYRIALHNVRSVQDAEDILQEVYVVLLTKRVPEDEEHLKNWLIRVTLNKCNSLHRSFWHKNTESIEQHGELIAEEETSVIEEIRLLPKDERNIIYLYYYESFTIAEIAKLLHKN